MLALLVLTALQPPVPPQDRPLTKVLTVSPAGAPKPALKIELLPRPSRQTPGNAAVSYYRAMVSRPNRDPKLALADSEKFDKWMAADLDRFPVKDVTAYLAEYRGPFKELDRAAECDRCDWDLLARLKQDGISTLLPELQPLRELARVLSLRTRLELAEGNFAAAEKSIRLGFQIAKHAGEGPTLINLLVGLAIQGMFLDRVDEWISRPGSPNLYWALTANPRPLIDPRIAFDGESMFLDATVPSLEKFRHGTLSKEQAARAAEAVFADFQKLGTNFGTQPADTLQAMMGSETVKKLGLAGYVAWNYESSKKAMLARGHTEKELAEMPAAQVVFLNASEGYLELRDDQWKWIGMPYHHAKPALKEVEARIALDRDAKKSDVLFALFAVVLPASEKVVQSIARLDRLVAILRAVEAVRMTAAAKGKLPAKLDDCVVPVPEDPFTGKPFEYATTATGFTLNGPPPEGEKPNTSNAIAYEIAIRKP